MMRTHNIMIPILVAFTAMALGCTAHTHAPGTRTTSDATPDVKDSPGSAAAAPAAPRNSGPGPSGTQAKGPAPAAVVPAPPARTPAVPVAKPAAKPVASITWGPEIQASALVNPLGTPIFSVALRPGCSHVAVGGQGMAVGVVSTAGKHHWKRDKVRNVCSRASCHEGTRVGFIPGTPRLMVALNGDTIRMFTVTSGQMTPFRGGFSGRIRSFTVGKRFGAALYNHGLAVWRTGMGLISKKKQPGMTRAYAGDTNILLTGAATLRLVSRGGKKQVETSTAGTPLQALRMKTGWAVLLTDRVLLLGEKLKRISVWELPAGHVGVHLVADGAGISVLTKNGNRLALLTRTGSKLTGRVVVFQKSRPSGSLSFAMTPGCLAAASGDRLWYAPLPP